MANQNGPNNPNWRGGRIVDPRGYVLLRVGVGHHLADVRGYAYEHRVLAEQRLGRMLRKGEEVHHRKSRGDNGDGDIEVKASHFHHMAEHRKKDRGLRMPGERNPVISCACGCGARFRKFDGQGRPRRLFKSGHIIHAAPTQDAILRALRWSAGALSPSALATKTSRSIQAIKVCLTKLKRAGLVTHCGHGRWSV